MTDAPEPAGSLFLLQPLTGRIFRVDPGPARAFRFEWGEKRWWLELTLAQFAREVCERACVSLAAAPVVALTGDWLGELVEMDYETRCALDDEDDDE